MENRLLELHLHLDGSLRPETVWELSKEQGIDLGVDSLEKVDFQMRVPADCKTLEEYLERFAMPLLVLQREDAIERVTFELVEDLAKAGLGYAEIRFAPQLSTQQGLTQAQVVEAAIRGAQRGMAAYPSIRAGLLLCCMRGDTNEAANLETVEMVHKYLGDVVCGVDIAGAEGLFPTEMFRTVFEKAKSYHLPTTIHAGEAAGPESVWTALEFGATRIGHGVNAVQDPKLMEELARRGTTLEVCPTSNLHTKVMARLEDHPVRQLFDAGVHVSISSDNMTVSNTDIAQELDVLRKYLHFTEEEIDKTLQYGWDARFLKD